MVVIIRKTFVEFLRSGNPARPLRGVMLCTLLIGEERIENMEYYKCLTEIERKFPNVRFDSRWTGDECIFTPSTLPPLRVSSENSLFFEEEE
jgi:hypothetical protein